MKDVFSVVKELIEERTAMPNMQKYKPETAFELGSERWFTTEGAVTGNTQRPEQIIRNTKRKVSKPLTGIAGPVNKTENHTRPKVKKSTERNFKGSGPRNATASGEWTNVDQGDYGASGYEVYETERATTGLRSHITNIATSC